MQSIDEYLTAVAPSQRSELQRIRSIVNKTVPEAEESISYDMPTFKYKGKRLIYFAAFKNHMSIYGSLGSLEDKLGAHKLSHKGTLQFTEKNPLPEQIIQEIVINKKTEIDKASSWHNQQKTEVIGGYTIKYHADGKSIFAKGKVINGQPDGYWEWYRPDGTLKRSGYFSSGKPVGEWTTYDQKGKVYKVTNKI
jgi:uncharacterized protein YdhG (YjbR/CyaY superfamily)